MSANKKRFAVLGAVGVTALVAAGAAWAAFGSGVEGSAAGAAETVEVVTVTGTQVKSPLLPSEHSAVKLSITNPNDNVRAQISGITPAGVVVGGTGNAATDASCANHIFQDATLADGDVLPTLGKGGSRTVTLPTGISLGNAPLACNGMTYTTKWKVDFTAIR
jgi:hypothetical protein